MSGGKVRFAADAILIAKITPCTENNKTALVPEIPTNGGYATTEVFAVHPSMWTNRLYLLYLLRSPQAREVLVRSMTGSTGRQRVPKQALEGLEIPLPFLDEQRRIAAHLNAVQAKVESIRRY
jgi:type I restriction enzyme S subunit